MATGERDEIAQVQINSAGLGSNSIADQIVKYYRESLSYLNGPLGGTCHFGYTPIGEPFDVKTSLSLMEMLLGQKISLPPGSTVLDAGCGFGRVATTIASKPYDLNVVGVDLIPERLEEASRFIEARGVSKKVELIS